MPEHTSILNLLLRSIFIGFGIVVPIVTLLKTSNLTKLRFKELFILTAVQAVRVGGILYTILFLVETFLRYRGRAESSWPGAVEMMLFGSYWYVYWFPPMMCLILSQLFWIRQLYLKKTTLIIFSLLLLILPSTRLLVYLINFGKGIDAVKFSSVTAFNILEIVLNIIVFIFIIITIMLAGNKFKKIKE